MEWKSEIREQLQKIKSEGQQYPQLEQELILRRREELRWAIYALDDSAFLCLEILDCLLINRTKHFNLSVLANRWVELGDIQDISHLTQYKLLWAADIHN